MPPTPIPVWLDVDTGHDDAFATLLAAQHPDLNLLGISTTFGNAPLKQTTHNTRAILKAINRPDVPVYAGAAKPFCRQTWHAAEIHGESGLDGTTCLPDPDVPVAGEGPGVAVKAMRDALMATEKGTAWLIPTGALTNAGLLLASYPEVAGHLAGVSIMGGAIGDGFTAAPMGSVTNDKGEPVEGFGNWTFFAEFNIYCDPEAAKTVLECEGLKGKIVLVPLDLSHLFLATEGVKRGLRWGFDGEEWNGEVSLVRKLFLEILAFFSKTYADVFGITDGPPVHDLLAVAAVLMPHVFDDKGGERFEVRVVTDGVHGPKGVKGAQESQCGRTLARAVEKGAAGTRIPRGVDADKVWRVLEGCLQRAEKSGSGGTKGSD